MGRNASPIPPGEMSPRSWRLPLCLAILVALAVVFPDRNLSLKPVSASDGITAYISAPFVQGPPSSYSTTIETFDAGSGCPSSSDIGTFDVSGNCVMSIDQWGGASTTSDSPTVGGVRSQYPRPNPAFTVTFTSSVRYVGFWWSSGSPNNTVRFYDSSNVNIATFTSNTINSLLGASAPSPYPGDSLLTTVNGSTHKKGYYFGAPSQQESVVPTSLPANPESHAYLSIFASGTIAFSKVEFSGGSGFELDNLAVSTSIQTPLNSMVFVESVLGKSVNFHANGGSGSMPAQTSNIAASLNTSSFTRLGYTFAGWCTVKREVGQSCTGSSYSDGANYNFAAAASDVTLYALWTANSLTVTYDVSNGGTTPAGGDSSTNTGGTLSSLAMTTRVGYAFNGWFTASSGGTQVTTSSAHGQTSNFTLYAQWTALSPSVTAPAAPTFVSNTSGQDPGDFVIANFSPTDTLLVSIGLVDPPEGTSFSLPVTTGLTPGFGYDFFGSKTQVSFTGVQSDANLALAAMTVGTGSSTDDIVIRVTASVSVANVYYNPINGHYYEYVSSPTDTICYSGDGATCVTNIERAIEAKMLYGVAGYWATITSPLENSFIANNMEAPEIAIGLSDREIEGVWKWIAGPESGQVASYTSWANDEPNDYDVGEDYVVTNWSEAGRWNDFGMPSFADELAYVVEYSGSFSEASSATATVTGVVGMMSPTFATATTRTASGGPYTFTVTFDVAVSGISNGDFEDAGSGSACSYSVTAISANVYSLTASSCFSDSSEGTVTPRLKANAAVRVSNSAVGPTSAVTSTVTITRDTTKPTITAFGSGTLDGTYKAGSTIVITATASENIQAGSSFAVTLDSGATVTLSTSITGTSFTGVYTVTAGHTSANLTVSSFTTGTVTDSSGNAMESVALPVTNIASSSTIIVDTTAPATLGAPDLATWSDTGQSLGDEITADDTPTVIVGVSSLEAGATGYVKATKVGSSTVTCTLAAGTCTLGTLGEGTWTIVSYQVDAATNQGSDSTSLSITIDRTSPAMVNLAPSSATSSSAAISFIVAGSEALDCATLGTTAGTDFNFADGISAISSIVQTNPAVCTVNATSTATAGGGSVTSTLTAAASFSIADVAGNTQTTLTGSPQSVVVTVPEPNGGSRTPTTTTPTTTATATPATTTPATTVVARAVTTTSIRRLLTTTTTLGAVTTLAPATSVATSSTVLQRVAVEVVVVPTTSAGVAQSGTTTATTLPLAQQVSTQEIQQAIAGLSSNVQDLSLPVFVNSQLPNPLPENPLVIQTTNESRLDIITVNQQVIQLQDTEGFRLSVSATTESGVLTPVSPSGAIIVEQQNFITVTGAGFKPNSEAVAWLFSEPRRLGVVRTGSDGAFQENLQIGPEVSTGEHTIQVNGLTPEGDVRSLNLAVKVIPQGAMPVLDALPTVIGSRSPRETLQPYSPQDDPVTTRELAVATTALLSLAAAGAAAERREARRGKLAGVVTKKLKALKSDEEGRGDRSATWRGAGTASFDRSMNDAPLRVGPFSALFSRILVDGAWLRAILGSRAVGVWSAAVALAVAWVVDTSGYVATPAAWLLCALLVVAALDATAGALAALVISTAAVIFNRVEVLPDVRALLGIWVLLISSPLLAHVIRPLRRDRDTENFARERVYDYVMMPVFVAFAAGSMAKALNGLSGLDLVAPSTVTAVKWAVWAAMILRLAGEDLAFTVYPKRSLEVQPAKLVSQTRAWGLASVAGRFGVFIFIAEPYFGINIGTVVAAILTALPALVKLWEDDLPNSERLFYWLPRGFLRFFLLLVIGGWMSSRLVGDDASPEVVRNATPWLLVPGAVVGVVEFFGRSGKSWRDDRVKHIGGAIFWLIAVLIVAGRLQLF